MGLDGTNKPDKLFVQAQFCNMSAFLYTGYIKSHAITILIDTSVSKNFIAKHLVDTLKIPYQQQKKNVQLANGTK